MAAERLAAEQLAEEEARAQAEKEAQRKAGMCLHPPLACHLSAIRMYIPQSPDETTAALLNYQGVQM